MVWVPSSGRQHLCWLHVFIVVQIPYCSDPSWCTYKRSHFATHHEVGSFFVFILMGQWRVRLEITGWERGNRQPGKDHKLGFELGSLEVLLHNMSTNSPLDHLAPMGGGILPASRQKSESCIKTLLLVFRCWDPDTLVSHEHMVLLSTLTLLVLFCLGPWSHFVCYCINFLYNLYKVYFLYTVSVYCSLWHSISHLCVVSDVNGQKFSDNGLSGFLCTELYFANFNIYIVLICNNKMNNWAT